MEFVTTQQNAGQTVTRWSVLEFVLPSQELSIWQLASMDAYNACDFSGATQVPLQPPDIAIIAPEQQSGYLAPGAGASAVLWVPPASGSFYFASGLPFYCSVYNMKVTINVAPQ